MSTAHRTTAVCLFSILLAAVAASASTPASAADAERDEPKPAWRNGPVRTILTEDEDKAFKALKTEEDRAAWIKEFWQRRDPSPGTPENEYRDDFYKRVDDANKEFREGAGSGWMTDRGRILLTSGYPVDRAATEDQETWTYNRPGFKVNKVVFRKNEAGEFRMEAAGGGLIDALHELDPLAAAMASLPPAIIQKLSARAAAPPTAASRAAEAVAGAAPAALPPGVERLKQATAEAEAKSEIALAVQPRYSEAEDGSTFLVVLLATKKEQITATADGKPGAVMYASLKASDRPEAAPIELADQGVFAFNDDSAEGWLQYAFAISLKPGPYELRAGMSDGPDGAMGTVAQSLVLPDFTGGALSLSSVILAQSSSPAGPDADQADPYTFGVLRLVPRMDKTLAKGDDLEFYFDVYNAKKDPATGKPSLDVSYTFEKKVAGVWKKSKPLVLADQHEEKLGYTILSEAISQWPEGDWRVSINVKDKVASAEVAGAVEFSLKK